MRKEQSKELKELFLLKRAVEGKSINTISKELKVSKNTIIKWNKELEKELHNLEVLEKEKLIEKYKITLNTRLEFYLKLRGKILQELNNRDLKKISVSNLFKLLLDVESIINNNFSDYIYTGEIKSLIENTIKYEKITINRNVILNNQEINRK